MLTIIRSRVQRMAAASDHPPLAGSGEPGRGDGDLLDKTGGPDRNELTAAGATAVTTIRFEVPVMRPTAVSVAMTASCAAWTVPMTCASWLREMPRWPTTPAWP